MLRVCTWNYPVLMWRALHLFGACSMGEGTLIQTEYVNLMRNVGQRMDALLLCG